MPVWLVGLRHLLRRFSHHDLAGLIAILRSPPLPGKMTPLQPDYVQQPGGLMKQSNTTLQRDGLAAGFCKAVD